MTVTDMDTVVTWCKHRARKHRDGDQKETSHFSPMR